MLDNQGFVVNAKSAKDGVNTTSKQMRTYGGKATASNASHSANKGTIIANDVVGTLHPHPADSDDRAIKRARKIEHAADKVWNAEMIGMFGGMGLGWVANKTKNDAFKVGVHRYMVAPFEALRETRLGEWHKLPANYMRSVANHAEGVAKTSVTGKAATMAANAENKVAVLEASGERFAEKISGKSSPAITSAKNGVSSGLNSFEGTGAGKQVLGGLKKFTSWRAEVNTTKHLKHLSKAEAALTQQPPGFFGFIDKIKYFFTGGGPKQIPAHDGLSEVTAHLVNARSATTSADRLMHMETAKTSLKKVARGAEGDLASRANHVLKSIEKSGAAASMAHHFEAAESQGIAGIARAAGKAVGRVSIFGAIMAVGMTAGLSAIVMTHRKENKEAKLARNEIAATIGVDSELMRSIDAAYNKNKGRHLTKSGLSSVSTIANGMMAAHSTGGGMGYMAASMLPAGVMGLVKEDQTLNAYANLRREETAGMKLPPDAKLAMIRQLVASVPVVAKAGGTLNNLAMPVAEEIMDRNLGARDTMKLLASGKEFSDLATQVLEKQKALKAAVAQSVPAVAPATKAAPMIGGKASVSGIVSEGRVSQVQKAATV